MKTIYAKGKYKVSFNTSIGEYEVGDSRQDTLDYAGYNIAELANEVINDSPEYPMVFKEVNDRAVVGLFCQKDSLDYPTAIMYK
jgi:hypothetical protein